ncbi:MAG: hypothetical protein U0228_20105 [Myxococcaceae bacterium]
MMRRAVVAVFAYASFGCDAGVQGVWRKLDVDQAAPPLEGVETCIRETADCATTDAKGHFDLSRAKLNLGAAYTLTAQKAGHVPVNYLRVRDGRDSHFDFSIATDGYYPAALAEVGATWSTGTGLIWLNDVSHVAGVSAELVGQPQAQRFFSVGGKLVKDRAGADDQGLIFFANVTPGDVTVRLIPAAGQSTCAQRDGAFAGSEAQTIVLRVEPGVDTNVETLCR